MLHSDPLSQARRHSARVLAPVKPPKRFSVPLWGWKGKPKGKPPILEDPYFEKNPFLKCPERPDKSLKARRVEPLKESYTKAADVDTSSTGHSITAEADLLLKHHFDSEPERFRSPRNHGTTALVNPVVLAYTTMSLIELLVAAQLPL